MHLCVELLNARPHGTVHARSHTSIEMYVHAHSLCMSFNYCACALKDLYDRSDLVSCEPYTIPRRLVFYANTCGSPYAFL